MTELQAWPLMLLQQLSTCFWKSRKGRFTFRERGMTFSSASWAEKEFPNCPWRKQAPLSFSVFWIRYLLPSSTHSDPIRISEYFSSFEYLSENPECQMNAESLYWNWGFSITWKLGSFKLIPSLVSWSFLPFPLLLHLCFLPSGTAICLTVPHPDRTSHNFKCP